MAIQLPGLIVICMDRDASTHRKTHGGGLCIYINTGWCINADMITKHYSPLVEFMAVKCRTYYLLWQFGSIINIVVLYIPLNVSANNGLRELYVLGRLG